MNGWLSSGISEVTPQEERLELDGWVKIKDLERFSHP
jgi:hypothetical protein